MQGGLRLLPAALLAVVSTPATASERPPNFILMVADDLGYGDLGVYGNPVIRTPNLDRVVREGARLTEFYAFPSCTPSRAALITGRYPVRSGLIRVLHPGESYGIPGSEVTLAEALKELGYTTALVGKWHLGGPPAYRPNRHGFDEYYGLLYSNDMTLMPPNFRPLRLYRNDKAIEWPVKQKTLTKRYTEESLAFIERNTARPFFLYLAHSMPHVPVHASDEFRGRSARGLYGDAVEEIDWSGGQLLERVRRLGMDDNTLVIFTSDNGPALRRQLRGGSAGSLRGGKQTTGEGGVRVPFLARWPGLIPAGTVRDGIATVMVFTTLIEAAGGGVPGDRPIDGKNLMRMLEGTSSSPHQDFYYYLEGQIFAVRSGDWKLHLFRRETGRQSPQPERRASASESRSERGGGAPRTDKRSPRKPQRSDAPELYNLRDDPSESRNVASEYPEIVSRLSKLAADFHASVAPGKLLPPFRPLPLR